MAKSTPQLEWCIVRLGEDHNWWVEEVSDPIRWDVDGLSIIDPRQVSHIVDLVEPMRDYGFDQDLMDRAFIPFRIDKDLGKGRVRIVRVKDSFFESEEKLFALPDLLDDENGPYADFLDHITRTRVKMLNDLFEFEQKLTVDEVEDEIREAQNNDFMEGKSIHVFSEVTTLLDYVPAGWEGEEGEERPTASGEDEIDGDDLPDLDADEEEKLKNDESLKWDEDEEKDEDDAEKKDGKEKDEDDDEDEDEEEDDDEDDEDEDEKPRAKRRGK